MGTGDRLGHLKAVQPRHHHVQDQQVIDSKLCIFRPRFPVVDRLHLEALLLQDCPDGLGQELFVLNDQNLHGNSPLSFVPL